MLRKLFPTGVLALTFAAGICLADPPADTGGKEGGGKDGDKAGQREGRPRRIGGEGRGEGGRRRGEGGPMRFDPKAELTRMTETLKLDEDQQATIGKVLENAQTKMTEQREKMRPSDDERAKMDAMREEMRAAREAGDDAKVQELRERMRESMGPRMEESRKAMDEIHKTLHDGIVAQLRDDQKPQFETMWAERMAMRRGGPGGPDGPGGPNRGPLALKAIVDKLDDLTADQKQQIETLFTTFRDANKDKSARPSPEAAKKLQADVMAVLTDGQKAKVEKTLSGNRRGPGGPGEGRGERPRRPRGDKPEEKHEGV